MCDAHSTKRAVNPGASSSPPHVPPHQPPSSHRRPSRAPTTTRMTVSHSPDENTNVHVHAHVHVPRATILGSRLTTKSHVIVVLIVLLLHLHFASVLHDNNITSLNNVVTRDPTTGKPVGDTSSAPTRSVVGFVQDCDGYTPRQHGAGCLPCGASPVGRRDRGGRRHRGRPVPTGGESHAREHARARTNAHERARIHAFTHEHRNTHPHTGRAESRH